MKKILALFAYADYNKGDSAICLGADKLLKKLYPDSEVYFANFLWPEHEYTKRTKEFYKLYNIKTIDIPGRKKSKTQKLSNIIFNGDKELKEFLVENNFDLVVSVGGHFLFSKDSSFKEKIRNKVRLLDIYQPVIEAKKAKIKTGILCQSVGPFNKHDLTINKIVNSLDFVITRESKSFDDIKKMHKKSESALDMAYFMDSPISESNPITSGDSFDYVVVNLRKVLASGGYEVSQDIFEKQLSYFAQITDAVIRKGFKVVLLSQVDSYDLTDSEVDTNIHKLFKEKYFKNDSSVILEEKIYTESELIRIYKDSLALISTRYHGLIFSILAGAKPIGVNIEGIGHKLTGMFTDLGIEKNIIQLNELELNSAVERTVQLLDAPCEYQVEQYINENYSKIKSMISAN